MARKKTSGKANPKVVADSAQAEKFELRAKLKTVQKKLPLKRGAPAEAPPRRRKKDSVRLVWDSKPKRPPSPKDIEFQTAEVVIPNPARDEDELPLSFHDGILGNEEIDKTQMNRLIWGDNLLAMQALLAQGYEGKIDLIYIDPPFDSKSDYSYRMSVQGNEVVKDPSVIERLAYSDTWEAGKDSYLDMLYPRVQLMRRLLSERGALYVHIGPNISQYVRILLDEVFGEQNFRNEIVWKRQSAKSGAFEGIGQYGRIHEIIFFYSKSDDYHWNQQYTEYDSQYVNGFYKHVEESSGRRFRLSDLTAAGTRTGQSGRPLTIEGRTVYPAPGRHWAIGLKKGESVQEALDRLISDGRISYAPDKMPQYKRYLDEMPGVVLQDIWMDIRPVAPRSQERQDFDTQKPEALLARMIEASSNEGDLVADFFSGSGTTLCVAQRLGRRWVGCDFGKVGIQVTRSRLVEQDSTPFLIENIGNYQREMIYLAGGRIYEMQRIILKLYGASVHPNHKDLGMRQGEDGPTELVYVGYPDRPTTARKVEELAKQAETLDGTGYKRLIILAWDYDYNFDTEWEARRKKMKRKLEVEVQPRMIPPDVYDYLKKAKDEEEVEKLADKVVFHEKPYLRLAKTRVKKTNKNACEVTIAIDEYVLFDLPVKPKEREKLREAMKDNFAILIDYWAIDWDYDGATFRSQWQAIRGNGKRAKVVPTKTTHTLETGKKYTIAVRVVDVFGNDAAATTVLKT